MPTFQFTARDTTGKWHNGTEAADTSAALAGVLRARGLSLVKAEQATSKQKAVQSGSRRGWGILPPASLDVELGLLMLANMLDGGLTLLSALKTCADQSRRVRMAKIWDDIHDQVAGGTGFAEAMMKHKARFPQLVIKLTQAGEATGNLEVVLAQAADQLERKRTLLVTVISAMLYPTVTTVVAIGVGAFLMVKIIPEISTFLVNSGKKLPAMTVALIATSDFIRGYGLTISVIVTSIVIALILLHKHKPTARIIDKILLKIPIVGKILRLGSTVMFLRGLGMLLQAGVPMISALETAGGLMKNQAVVHRVELTRLSVLAGNGVSRTLGRGGEFLPMLPRMVAIGEETGTLTNVLEKVAHFHEKQLEAYVKRMTLLIEPVMTLVVGAMVGFVYLAFFMAIYSVAGNG